MGVEALIANIPSDMQALWTLFGFQTVVFLRIVIRFEVDYYDAFAFVG